MNSSKNMLELRFRTAVQLSIGVYVSRLSIILDFIRLSCTAIKMNKFCLTNSATNLLLCQYTTVLINHIKSKSITKPETETSFFSSPKIFRFKFILLAKMSSAELILKRRKKITSFLLPHMTPKKLRTHYSGWGLKCHLEPIYTWVTHSLNCQFC